MKFSWKLKNTPESSVYKQLGSDLNIPESISKVLVNRGIKDFNSAKEYFRPQLADLHDPHLLDGMSIAVKRLAQAHKSSEKIIIYGDYDVDGTTSVTMMVHFLKAYTNCDVSYYIPDRYKEGYGVSQAFINELDAESTDLVITLDCGIRAVSQITSAAEKNVDFIICDHHEPGAELPPAVSILNPKKKNCSYPFKGLSGCGVGFKLIQALSIELDLDQSIPYQYLDLLTISIGADIVPLNGENRILAFYGLKEINGNTRLGLQTIMSLAGIKKSQLSISDVVFMLAPRINAAGRIGHAESAVELLLADEKEQAEAICQKIESFNKERRSIDKSITREAIEIIENDSFYHGSNSTVVWDSNWHKGVIGIVASRLIEHQYKPTIVLTEKEGIATGSARSINGIDIHEALCELDDILIKYGGHTMAAGLSIKTQHLPEFRARFDEVIREKRLGVSFSPSIEIDLEIDLDQINKKFYSLLAQMAPFGPYNMTPLFTTSNLIDAGHTKLVGESKDHLKLTVIQKGISDHYLSGIAFKQGHHYDYIKSGKPFDAVYAVSVNEWNGTRTLQLEVRDIKPTEA